MKTYYTQYLEQQTKRSRYQKTSFFGKIFQLYGFFLARVGKTIDLKSASPHTTIPDLGTTDDVNNLVIRFDRYWRQEPKESPSI